MNLIQSLRDFADSVQDKVTANAPGEAEAQLTAPVSTLIEACGKLLARKLVAKAESRLGDRLGIPDYGILAENALLGFVELKAPGHGADTARFKGRDKEQWERFRSQPNILYTDGQEWCLYQNGEPVGELLRFQKDITKHGAKGVSDADADRFHAVLTQFLAWKPSIPKEPAKRAELLAPLCRLLRGDVAEALRDPASPLVNLRDDWRKLLFPNADDAHFADAYAQTVTFGLLLARSEGADVSDLRAATATLQAGHTLLSRAVEVLTDENCLMEIAASVRVLQRVIAAFPDTAMATATDDPWLYFYEHFLEAYDPDLRRDTGAYYTPAQVVRCQVALVDELLRTKLKKAGGFAHKDVITLDPAVGTGTYLLGVIDRALNTLANAKGLPAVPAEATALAGRLYGFEIQTGPYAVAELRLSRAIAERGGQLPTTGLGILLADTLENPFALPPKLPTFFQPISEHYTRALEIKDKKSVIVCIGNPPYDRHEAVGEETAESRARTGGWVRWGESGNPNVAILNAFTDSAKAAGHGGDLKNLYNLYVYFWRWAMWKVFEREPLLDGKRAGKGENAGVVAFITASSFLRGDAFCGMREQLRRLCHEVYVLELGGEGRGTRQDDNVFNILSPVAICIAVRTGTKNPETPAEVKYTLIRGTRDEKYKKLAAVTKLADLEWSLCPNSWHAPLRPAGVGPYFDWPLIADLLPWQHTGLEFQRSWPIAPDTDTLRRRWKSLLTDWQGQDRAKPFKESRDRSVTEKYPRLLRDADPDEAIATLSPKTPLPACAIVAFRSLDRHFVIADARVGDYLRPPLWEVSKCPQQLYLTTLTTDAFGGGPALVATHLIPDRHHFNNRGGKDVFPLYRDAAGKEPNNLPGLLALWGKKLKRDIAAEDFAAYLYAILGHGGFVKRFWVELEDCQLRVPLTLDAKWFDRAVAAGRRLLFLHTFGERCVPSKATAGELPGGTARVRKAISEKSADYPDTYGYDPETGTIRVGAGEIGPVSAGVWEYEVSGFKVVQSWLGYRMKNRKGRKTSPLDKIHPERWTSEFTTELLNVLWILEHTLALWPELDTVLEGIVGGKLLPASELPDTPDYAKKPPKHDDQPDLYADANDDAETDD